MKTEGSKIEWHEKKNLTKKLVTKKQKNKKTGGTRTITKEVDCESFFQFFRSVDISNDEEFNKLPDDEVELFSYPSKTNCPSSSRSTKTLVGPSSMI